METTENIVKGKAEKYTSTKTLICPFEAYEGYIAGYNECLKDQSKISLQKIRDAQAEVESKLEPYAIKIETLSKELQKKKEKNGNAGPGNNSGNGNQNPGGGGNNGNGNGHGGNGNNGNGNGNGHGGK